MAAYVVSMMSIQDPKIYKKYTDRTPTYCGALWR
jgi:uncharacterized protein (DUF1330 family)